MSKDKLVTVDVVVRKHAESFVKVLCIMSNITDAHIEAGFPAGGWAIAHDAILGLLLQCGVDNDQINAIVDQLNVEEDMMAALGGGMQA